MKGTLKINFLLLLGLIASGCSEGVAPVSNEDIGGGPVGTDSGSIIEQTADTGIQSRDAEPKDLGFLDANVLMDAGMMFFPDASTPDTSDSGAFADAEVSDASLPTPDSGLLDATMVLDSGAPDSGTVTSTLPPSYRLEQGRTAYYDYLPRPPNRLNLRGQVDAWAAITTPFEFEILGQTVTAGSDLFVSSNGALRVRTATATGNNVGLSDVSLSQELFVAVNWDDFILDDDVYALTSPDEIRILWSQARLRNSTDSRLSFQVRISRVSNVVEFRYLDNTRTSSGTATIGISDGRNQRAYELPCSPRCSHDDFYPGSVISFTPENTARFYPDFAFQSVTMSVLNGYRNERLELDAVITNLGNIQGTPNVLVQALFSPSAIWVIPSQAQSNASLAFLAPQPNAVEANTISVSLTNDPGVYNVALWLDDNYYSEQNNTNNLLWVGQFEILPYIGQIQIADAMLPVGQVGQYYEYQFTQTGAPQPNWSTINPPVDGLQLSSTGLLYGTPTRRTPTLGEQVEIEVTQRGYAPAQRSFNLRIYQ